MSGQLKRIAGPAYLAATATNIYTPPASTIYTVIEHLHVANVTASAATFTLYVGATGGSTGGTELFKQKNIPANDAQDYYFTPGLFMASTDFLTGLASAGSTIAIAVMGEQIVV